MEELKIVVIYPGWEQSRSGLPAQLAGSENRLSEEHKKPAAEENK